MNEIVNNKVNLCDSCSQVYPDCTSKPEDVYFGDGIGHDNICACSEYQPRTTTHTTATTTDTISRAVAIDALKSLEFRQYMEFGEYVGEDTKEVCLIRAEKAQDALQSLPPAQPQLEECPIYGGMCGYPSNLCYECPRHGGAHEKPLWWTAGLQPFAQSQSTMGQVTDAVQSTKDCISRQAAIDALGEKPLVWDDLSDFDLGKAAQWSDDVDAIKALPSAQPQRSKGRWEIIKDWDGDDLYRCSECGSMFTLIDGTPEDNDYNFCPSCGADMRGEQG